MRVLHVVTLFRHPEWGLDKADYELKGCLIWGASG